MKNFYGKLSFVLYRILFAISLWVLGCAVSSFNRAYNNNFWITWTSGLFFTFFIIKGEEKSNWRNSLGSHTTLIDIIIVLTTLFVLVRNFGALNVTLAK